MARLLVGVSGGIAAYKALELVRLATAAGHAVRVIQTPTSTRFVGTASFAALSGAPVLQDEFERDPARGAFPDQLAPSHDPFSHLELVRNADVFIIAPATANTIARIAHGLADNLLCTAALAATCPVVVAPAMNNHMYEHPANQANLELLRRRGVTIMAPQAGRLASAGEWGVGRLAEPTALLAACEALVESARASAGSADDKSGLGQGASAGGGRLDGLRALVTAGGTREPIDSVRFLGNRSSGRMGFALAEVAADRGARVTVIAANVGLARDPRITYVDVQTAAELNDACQAAFPSCDVLLMAAAVADFRPARATAGKIKKAGRERLTLTLEPTQDVLGALAGARHPGQTLIGFAAEHGPDGVALARAKLEAKGVDAIVVNDVSRAGIAFDAPDNEVSIVTAQEVRQVGRAPKAVVAGAILDAVTELRASPPVRPGMPHPLVADPPAAS
jgi:phosphopantothenoylcysteine decarboxylase/phosphopantothenate--cysteine ligase